MSNNVTDINDYKEVEDIVKDRLSVKNVIITGINKEGQFFTYIDPEITDIDLTYVIQILKDRRVDIFREESE